MARDDEMMKKDWEEMMGMNEKKRQSKRGRKGGKSSRFKKKHDTDEMGGMM